MRKRRRVRVGAGFADGVTALKCATLICSAFENVIPRVSMMPITHSAVVVTILIAASAAWAGPGAIVPCCFPDGVCQELSPSECESSGADPLTEGTCTDPNPCIVCCRFGDPLSCEDNITLRNCRNPPTDGQFVSRAVCGSEGQCLTISGGECTDPAQCATGFCVDGICTDVARAPALTPGALVLLVALLFGGALFTRRRGISRR